jgi:decaprenylphospho-beta-D-erythro-pentofuranosid-2-ulose 2-reductase
VTVEHPHAVLLVGGSSQIGLAILDELTADHPCLVLLAGRDSPALTAAAARQRAAGHTVHRMEYDASWSAGQTRELVRQADGLSGGLDLVLVAIGMLPRPAAPPGGGTTAPPDVREHGLEQVLQANLTGPALVASEAAGVLCARGRGQLAVVTSASAVRPRGEILGYSAAKQALDSFVRGLDRRTMPHGVRCYVVRPGQVRTRMTAGLADVPLTTGPSQVAVRVRRALGRRSGVVWSPALMRPASLILKMAPNWALPEALR